MTHNEQLKLIREAFKAIPDLQDGFKDVAIVLYDMNTASEKRHRRGTTGHGLPVTDAARLFTVRYLLDGYAEPDRFTVDDITSIRNEVLYAQAYAKRFHEELSGWAAKYTEPFEQVDYSELQRKGQR